MRDDDGAVSVWVSDGASGFKMTDSQYVKSGYQPGILVAAIDTTVVLRLKRPQLS